MHHRLGIATLNSAYIFSDYAKILCRISQPLNLTNIRTQVSVWYNINSTNFENVLPKKWNSYVFHQGKFSRVKRSKKSQKAKRIFKVNILEVRSNRPKIQINVFRPTNLKRIQISEIWPKKGQPGNPGITYRRKQWKIYLQNAEHFVEA